MNLISNTNHDEMIPSKFHLSQNYPNPFKEKTIIKYCIAFKTKVSITVSDFENKLIETLVQEEKEAGTYELTWNAENLPSGVYFYQIKAGTFVETKKMLLLK
jgi:flagellar hook assembly protein FlgD